MTPNHPTNGTVTGPNGLLNFPVILAAVQVSYLAPTVVRFTLDARPGTYTIEFFANDKPDPSGYGQGQKFIGATSVAVQGISGQAFTAQLPPVSSTQVISATATRVGYYQYTSEFSADAAVTFQPPQVVAAAFAAAPQPPPLVFTFNQFVRDSISPAAIRVHDDTSGADIPVTRASYDDTNTATFFLPVNLPPGDYTATLLAHLISNGTQHLDGNGDLIPGGDYVFHFSVLQGDINGDGVVNFDDLLILSQNFGHGSTFAEGNLNGDGKVDFGDLLILAQNYGSRAAAAAGRSPR